MLKKSFFPLVIAIALFAQNAHAQNGLPFAIHFSSPTSLASKFRIKGELRLDSLNSVLLCYTQYWGLYPGRMLGAEYRHYWPQRRRGENYVYGEGGVGRSYPISIFATHHYDDEMETGVVSYFGGGVGRHINMGVFFFDMNAGLRATILSDYPDGYFNVYYLTGPGAFLRINFAFGFQFPPKWYKRRS